MPYIDRKKREAISGPYSPYINMTHIETAGDMQYAFALIVSHYLRASAASYQRYNDVLGALAGAQQEVYRRLVAPYEDAKKESNGDVY